MTDAIITEAEALWQDLESIADTEWATFKTKMTPLFQQLQAFATTTGRADVTALLSDLESGLVAGITGYLTTGGNAGAAISAVATTELAKLTTDVTTDAKNAVYGGLAIVAAGLPAIVATPAVPATPTPTTAAASTASTTASS